MSGVWTRTICGAVTMVLDVLHFRPSSLAVLSKISISPASLRLCLRPSQKAWMAPPRRPRKRQYAIGMIF